jgi:hypothetical protein
MKKVLFFSIVTAICLNAANIEMLFSTLKFNYKEYGNSGVLDSESSKFNDIKGIDFSINQYFNKNKITLNLEYNRGETHYNGTTWGGAPLSLTRNNAYLYNTNLIFNYFIFNDKTDFGEGNLYLSGGFGYRYWNRGKSDYSGDYNEKYKWSYYLIGFNANENFSKIDFDINFYYQRAISPKMDADLFGGITYDLGKTDGYRFEFPIRYHLSKNYGLMAKYIYDYWKINKSTPVIINNLITYEPESKTKNQYINIGFYYNF